MIYTTNAVESLYSQLCRFVRMRGHFRTMRRRLNNMAAIAREYQRVENASKRMEHRIGRPIDNLFCRCP